MLFSDRSILTMIHGIVLGGGALMALFASLFAVWTAGQGTSDGAPPLASRRTAQLLVATAVLLWLTVIAGTYVTFPPYRATPPPGTTDLSAYPRFLIDASTDTQWLHAFGMESKEHMPWIAAMLVTAVAFVSRRDRWALVHDARLRRMALALLVISFALASFAGLMGIFVNKVAPLE